MNISNILTVLRVLLIPFFLIFLLSGSFIKLIIADIILIIASLTDYFDGYFARKYGLTTEFGKFLDPLSDKLLTISVYISFCFLDGLNIPFWVIIPIIFRDIVITVLRIMTVKRGKLIETKWLAKLKTAVQMYVYGIILLIYTLNRIFAIYKYRDMFSYNEVWLNILGVFFGVIINHLPFILVAISSALTLYSGIDYLISYYKAHK